MKNITLSAESIMIRKARERAEKDHTTLNDLFRTWLARYAGTGQKGTDYRDFMKKVSYPTPGRKFSREEMNER